MKKLILIAFIALISIVAFSCKKDSSGMLTVKYTIQGTSKSTVTYSDASGNMQTVNNADASWTNTFSSSNHGMALKLTVISTDGSQVGGKIFIDGTQSAQQNGVTGSVSISSTLP
jgi:hypothetical protein